MSDMSPEGGAVQEPELTEEVLGPQAQRLDEDLTRVLETLPQYVDAKEEAERKGDPVIEFKWNGWACEDMRYPKVDGALAARDFTMIKQTPDRTINETYTLDRLTDSQKREQEGRLDPRTNITFVYAISDEVGQEIHERTQTAIDRFDARIRSFLFRPNLRLIRSR